MAETLELDSSLDFISCFCLMTSAKESTFRFLAILFSKDNKDEEEGLDK